MKPIKMRLWHDTTSPAMDKLEKEVKSSVWLEVQSKTWRQIDYRVLYLIRDYIWDQTSEQVQDETSQIQS